jgi:hypothetical protein
MNSLAHVYDAALDGDMRKALSLLDAIDFASLDDAQRPSAAKMRARFSDPPADDTHDLPEPASRILAAYRSYWRDAMLRRTTHDEAKCALLDSLRRVVEAEDLDAASDAGRAAIEAAGLHALTGVTLPFYELMIWRTSTPTQYRVSLPEQEVDVTVVFLEDFVSLGWAAYATGDRAHTGGWATATELYAVRQAYDETSESFRVSYLAHEGQHFADYKRYPKLEQPELEYRAKLTELALSEATTRDLVANFANRTGDDRGNPHYFAHRHLVRGLTREVGGDVVAADAIAVRNAARALLAASSRALDAQGASTVARWLA